MSKYFIYLNIGQLLVFAATIFFLRPMFSWVCVATAFLGGMLTAGLATWQYETDDNPDKEYYWLTHYYNKDYPVEIAVQAFFVALSVVLCVCCSLFETLWHLCIGFSLMCFSNITLEFIWLHTFHKIILRQWNSKNSNNTTN